MTDLRVHNKKESEVSKKKAGGGRGRVLFRLMTDGAREVVYRAPEIISGRRVAAYLRDLPKPVLAVTMDIPWRIVRQQTNWAPDYLHFVTDMELATLEHLHHTLPAAQTIVGLGGGSCCDTAKFLAWKRGCPMVLVPTIISVDAPLTNMIAVRIRNKVNYVGDIWPERLLVDHDIIRQAPMELNRAGAADIASIHTARYDWAVARDENGEPWDAAADKEARQCLTELDRHAEEVRDVTPKGIDTVIDLYRREVAFCARIGSSRPEEGSEHLVAYNVERVTRRHFVHGDLVALGIYVVTRIQDNHHAWAVDLMDRLGLRYRVPGLARRELVKSLETLAEYIRREKMFYSVLNMRPVSPVLIEEVAASLCVH